MRSTGVAFCRQRLAYPVRCLRLEFLWGCISQCIPAVVPFLRAIGSPRVISHHHAPHLVCKADRCQAPQDGAIDSSDWVSSPLANRTTAIPCSEFARRAPAGAAGSVFSVHPAHSGQQSFAALADARQRFSSIWSWPLPEKATRRTLAEGWGAPIWRCRHQRPSHIELLMHPSACRRTDLSEVRATKTSIRAAPGGDTWREERHPLLRVSYDVRELRGLCRPCP